MKKTVAILMALGMLVTMNVLARGEPQTLGQVDCLPGQVLKSDGEAWGCGDDISGNGSTIIVRDGNGSEFATFLSTGFAGPGSAMAAVEVTDLSGNIRKALVTVSRNSISAASASFVLFDNSSCTGQKYVKADEIGLGGFGSAVGELTHSSQGAPGALFIPESNVISNLTEVWMEMTLMCMPFGMNVDVFTLEDVSAQITTGRPAPYTWDVK